ncbi:MAG: GMC family oxidoreductase N-terminal domain-containing protein [Polaromonas sp.]|uniref:GMC family oxidoreductase n=1 Tax=Polaromonas sp. TaxID=1869339 RepID=UPI0025E63ECD|nr:GMC family oxidoreductase N-terminal domain-containing protein [Polaromonas sp.]MBI2726538.1 GMC family oxidoreductase N-terminal domain-containing protein [Polaromonas sp.]
MLEQTFDYVIVGAGTAGCVLANRLSEDPEVRVLLLEAGGRDTNPLISIPLGMGKMHEHNMHDWGYETEPEPQLNNRRLEAMRGKVLGGSSSINVMAYTRGHRNDYDNWAANGAQGWGYEDVLPYFRKSETWEGGADKFRGGEGPVGTQFARTKDPIFDAWMTAGAQAGFPVTTDYNGTQQEGFGRSQYTIKDGRRSSSSRAYLAPARHRRNLVVISRAHVLKVVMRGNRAVGVDYIKNGQVHAQALKEVILSAGAFNSPQILMLSGIGSPEELGAHQIKTVLDLPGVGKNLQDHLGTWITWRRKSPGAFHGEMRFDRMALSMIRAYLLGTGPGTTVPGGLHAFVKTNSALQVPDIEYMFHTVPPQRKLWFPLISPPYQDGYAIRPTLLHPKSRGTIKLRSANPQDSMRISFGFFAHSEDLTGLRRGFRLAREIGNQSAMNSYRDIEVSPGPGVRSDDEIDDYIRGTALTAHHPCGTCSIGDSELAVVDRNLKVRGAEGLRVVDASVMPTPVSAHPNACVFMIGERAAELVKQAA